MKGKHVLATPNGKATVYITDEHQKAELEKKGFINASPDKKKTKRASKKRTTSIVSDDTTDKKPLSEVTEGEVRTG